MILIIIFLPKTVASVRKDTTYLSLLNTVSASCVLILLVSHSQVQMRIKSENTCTVLRIVACFPAYMLIELEHITVTFFSRGTTRYYYDRFTQPQFMRQHTTMSKLYAQVLASHKYTENQIPARTSNKTGPFILLLHTLFRAEYSQRHIHNVPEDICRERATPIASSWLLFF